MVRHTCNPLIVFVVGNSRRYDLPAQGADSHPIMGEATRLGFSRDVEATAANLLGRFSMPEEIADAPLYMASSEMVSGEVLLAEAGLTVKMAQKRTLAAH